MKEKCLYHTDLAVAPQSKADGQRKDDRSGKPATSEMKLVTRVTRTTKMETKSWRHIPVHALRSRTREAAKQRWRKKIRPASIDEQRDKEKWRKEEMNTWRRLRAERMETNREGRRRGR